MNAKQQRGPRQSQTAPDLDETIVSLDPDSGITDQLRRRLLLRRFWQSVAGFWGAAGGRRSWLLTGAILLLILLNLAASYGMNIWNRAIFDALEQGDATPVFFLSMVYFPLLAASVCLVVAQVYARMTTQRRWREWLTHHLLDRWLTNGRYYQLHLVHGDHKNPECRIAADVRLATDSPVDFTTGVITAVLSAATFITVLWTIGGSLSLSLAGVEITIPGFLVVAAVAYAMLTSGSMVFIGHRFVTVSESKNQSEAELRYVLTQAERERRKHCRARRGGRGARCSRHVVDHGVAPLARPLLSNDAHDDCLADQQLHPAGSADHPPVERGLHVRAEISRRHDVAGLGLRRPSAFRR